MRPLIESGNTWLGKIPENWIVLALKYLCTMQAGQSLVSEQIEEEGLYPVYGGNGQRGCYNEYNCEGEKLVVGRQGALCGNVHKVEGKFWATEHAVITNATPLVSLDFLYYLLIGMNLNQYVSSTAAQPGLAVSTIQNIRTCLPSMSEQRRIASFLDAECARIDAVIDQTRASIKEYKKLKQAVITQAVKKGIREGREMKESRVAWIGKVPCEWQVTKLKYFSTIRSGITLGKVYPSGTELIEYPYLRVANVQGSYTDLRDIATIAVTGEEAEKYRLHDGELLMTEGGDRDKLGRGTVWHAEIDPCLHQNHVFALRTSEKLLAEYVSYLTDSYVGRDYFDVTANQSVHLASTNSTTILNFIIPLPPVEEQKEILAYLDEKVRSIDELMAKKEELLSYLSSLKKSVIFEYVTGKREI